MINSKSLEEKVRLACRLEVLSEKPGNVSPQHQFEDANLNDFLKSADVIAPILARSELSLGQIILEAVIATREAVGHNTNLGIILLLAPLAQVTDWDSVEEELTERLQQTTVQDAKDVYEAIRIAMPGGLGNAKQQDVHDDPTMTLLECMMLAADHDSVALQYASRFDFILTFGKQLLKDVAGWRTNHEKRIGWLAVKILAHQSDTLITRKCGTDIAMEVQRLATDVLAADWPMTEKAQPVYDRLDTYLRSDGNRRNPGTTADLIAAILFCGLRSGFIQNQPGCHQPVFVEKNVT